MKKLWVLVLALAALVTLSCPSEPDPPVLIEEFDFVITNGGNYRVAIPVDGPPVNGHGGFRITHGEEYTVTFVIEAADEDFYPSHVGGKLVYKTDEAAADDIILSGWDFSTPDPVAAPGTYRWTFKAGEQNDDDKPVANPATTPDGAAQYFTLNAQNSSYQQYPAYYEFRIKGGITVAKKTVPVGTLGKTADIVVVYTGSDHDESIGKGNIEGAEFTKVQAAAGNGSFLRFYITGADVSEDAGKDGNGVGSVGNRDNVGGDNPNPQFRIPKGTQAQSNFGFTVDVEVEVALEFVGAGQSHLFINMWGDGPAVCSKVELWEYK